ncbi:hypothetical protein KKF32_03600 [Patescibacteria group bacterium]|nr:hypothetical protein [Patescibacteria group bacterium]
MTLRTKEDRAVFIAGIILLLTGIANGGFAVKWFPWITPLASVIIFGTTIVATYLLFFHLYEDPGSAFGVGVLAIVFAFVIAFSHFILPKTVAGIEATICLAYGCLLLFDSLQEEGLPAKATP